MVRLIGAASLACIASLGAGCAVVPASSPRAASAEFPGADAWPARDPAAGALTFSMIPDFVSDEGAFGAGHIYRLDVHPDKPWEVSSMIFRADNPGDFSTPLSISWEEHEWFIPGATTTLMLREVRMVDTPLRGTCVYLCSLVGVSDPESVLVHELLMRGWRVLIVWPSIQTYTDTFYAFPSDTDLESAARTLANGADAYLAGTAFGVEAFVRWAAARHPDVREHPVVVVGSSLGAIATPTAVARLRSSGASRVDAAVLIGGGAGLLDITAHSPVMRDRFGVLMMERANDGSDRMKIGPREPVRFEALLERAQQLSRLDPGVTAPALRDIPVLQLHADFDEIVPARTGDALWERLDRPERWTYPTGHTGLFLLLPYEADDIARWLDGALPPHPAEEHAP
jgi:pimeloyl-ACP methyl ester carboxylesterase